MKIVRVTRNRETNVGVSRIRSLINGVWMDGENRANHVHLRRDSP